jgi:L-threonylcarbamoyladenylate synthase
MTEVLAVDRDAPDDATVRRAADCLVRGGLVAFPTETVYGLGVDACSAGAVQRLFDAKGRPSSDPLIVHVARWADVEQVARELPASARDLAARFWPGPLTLVLPKANRIPPGVTAGLDTVGVRVPAHPVALALLNAAAIPVAAPSANLFSRPSPTRADHVLQDLAGRIDLVLDAGPTLVGVESTVLDLTGSVPIVLRPGAVTVEMLETVVPRVEVRTAALASGQTTAMPSPGMLARHYAPRAPLALYEDEAGAALPPRLLADARAQRDAGRLVGVLAADEDQGELAALPGVRMAVVGSTADLAAVASRLYAALRELDAAGVDVILARGFPATSGLGVAISDRLRRAATPGGPVSTPPRTEPAA